MSLSSVKHICKALRNPNGLVIGVQMASGGANTVESVQGELIYRISDVILGVCRNAAGTNGNIRLGEIERKIVEMQMEITEDIRRTKAPI